MRFDIITIFPKIFDSYLNESILKRAQDKKIIQIKVHNLRDFAENKSKKGALRQAQGNFAPWRKIDDKPYGGGAGMVIMAEPIIKAVDKIKKNIKGNTKVILFSVKGKFFDQKMAYVLAKKYKNIIFITGRYEGIDERAKQILKAEELSIGPYVLTDGDVAAMTVISAVSRLIPGAINFESLREESYFNSIIQNEVKKGIKGVEYPHYTRPKIILYKGKKYKVPKALISGNHEKIAKWRKSKIK